MYGQNRPGPKHGGGGRRKGSGRQTRTNFGRGARRAIGSYLCETSAEALSSACGIPMAAGERTVKMLHEWSTLPGSEEVWLVPGVFGVVARWGEWRRDSQGKSASVCVWLGSDGLSRCTCIGATSHHDNHVLERRTTCRHAGIFDALLGDIASALGAPADKVRQQFVKRVQQEREADGDDQLAAHGSTFHVLSGLYVAVCPSAIGVVPVPVYLTSTRSSCSFCLGARTRCCSLLAVAQECGAPNRAHHASAQSSTRSLEVSAVSRLPLPLHNCIAAVRLNGEVSALAAAGGVFSVPAPSRCLYCTSRGEEHELSNPSTREGVMVCSRGFCKTEVVVSKCSSCKQWVSRDGRDQHIILLTTTTAATVCWARSMASSAADGMALTTSTTRWLRAVRRGMVAGVLPQDCPTRSGRILRNIVLVALKLMVEQLPSALFSCHHCMDADGRYLCVSAASIWVGFGSGVEHVTFQHVTEAVPENRQAVRAAYLVRGESVRRVIRDVMNPCKDFKLLARTTRPAEIAVSLLLPEALPSTRILEATAAEEAIAKLLSSVYDMEKAGRKLLVALKGALATYKTRNRAEGERRSAAARHLSAYIDAKRPMTTPAPSGPTTPAEHPPRGAADGGTAPSRRHATTPTPVGLVRNDAVPVKSAGASNFPGRAKLLLVVRPANVASHGWAAKKRKPDCGRKAFNAGKGDVDTTSPFLRSHIKELDKDSRRELLSFVTAITIDSVVLPFRPCHAAVLRTLAEDLLRPDHPTVMAGALALATSGEQLSAADKTPTVELLRDLRFMHLGVPSCVSLFPKVVELNGALAGVLVRISESIDKFVLEWRNGPEQTRKYQESWGGVGKSQAELCDVFKKAHPSASGNHEVTGTCAPSLPQCRPEPFLWEEVLSTGMCSKHYAKAHKFSPGAMTFCCGCKHPLILAFTVLDRKEAPQVLLNMLLTRFARLPRFLIYDFSCGAFRVALGKIGWLLMDCTIVSDRFHIFNHLCSDAFDPRSYTALDGVDSGAPEQRNAPIRRIQTTLQGMGVAPYTNLLAYQTGLLNHEAQTKWDLGVERLPEDVDLAGAYFSKYACLCCDGDDDRSSDDSSASREVSEGEGQSGDESGSSSSQHEPSADATGAEGGEGETVEACVAREGDADGADDEEDRGSGDSASPLSEDVDAVSLPDSTSSDGGVSVSGDDSFDE